jgi:hypothetical protein
LVEQLQGGGTLTGDDAVVVEGRNGRAVFFRDDAREGFFTTLLVRGAIDNLAAVMQDRSAFRRVGVFRHDHGRGGVTERGRQGQGGGVVARRMGGDTPPDGVLVETEDRVYRAPELESTSLLKVFALEKY